MSNYLYTTGSASLAANSDIVTGAATAWSGVNVKPGDTLNVAGRSVIIASVTDATHLRISSPWSSGSVSNQPYTIVQNSPAWGQVRELSAAVADAISKLNVSARIHLSDGVPSSGYAVTHNAAIDVTASPPRLYVSNGSAYTPLGYADDIREEMKMLKYECGFFVKREISALPPSPADGDAYIVKAGGAAPLADKANKIAIRKDGSWVYCDPPRHVSFYVESLAEDWIWRGSEWQKNTEGYAYINADGTIDNNQSKNVSSVSKFGTGKYKITTSQPASVKRDIDKWRVDVQPPGGLVIAKADAFGDGIWIEVQNNAGTEIDHYIRVMFW